MELQRDPGYAHLRAYTLPISQELAASFDVNNLKKFREQSSFIEKIAGKKANFMDVFCVLRDHIYQFNKQEDKESEKEFYGVSLFANKVIILMIIFQKHESALQEIQMVKALGGFKG